MADKEKYFIPIEGKLVEVEENVYATYYKMGRRERYLEERDKNNGVLSYDACNGVQREHNKKLNNGLPILHKVPPKRDYGRYFCILAEKGGTSHGGLTEKLSPFQMIKPRKCRSSR